MTARGRARRFAVVLLAAAALLTGCGALPGRPGPRFVVEGQSGISQPVSIAVVGLTPGENVVLAARAVTVSGPWTARAVYGVPPSGVVDAATARPVLAPYPRADAGALLWSMDGPSLSQDQLERTWAAGAVRIRLSATQYGREVAATTLVRVGFAQQSAPREVLAGDVAGWSGVSPSSEPPFNTPVGRYVPPDPPSEPTRPAVIVVDGDDGGSSGAFLAGELAAAGFPAFILPAFGPEGQIPGSAALTVESFDAALTWLVRQPAVDDNRVFVLGSGRAAPLALWFAVNRPDEVYGAIAASGPTTVLCASTTGAPLLVDHGSPVACEDPARPIDDISVLPLDSIPGPLLLACGTRDDVVPGACDWMAEAVLARGARPGDSVLRAVGAGHSISTPPLLPIALSDSGPAVAQATEDARSAFWDRVVALLRDASRS